jgi:putative glutamine transport system substrate-binding protein
MARKHRFALLGALCAAQAFVIACGALPLPAGLSLGDVARIGATPGPAYAAPSPTPPPANLSTAGLVRKRGKLLVGVRFDAPPLSSVNAAGELEGLDIDLAREFARRWLGSPDKVDFSQVTSASALRRVADREVDLAMGGLVQTRAGELQVDWSLPYVVDGDALLVRTGVFTNVAGLARKNIVYVDVENTASLRSAPATSGFTVTLKSVVSYPAAFQLLRAGGADAVLGKWRRLRLEAAANTGVSVLEVLRREPVALALPQGDPDWAALVNATLNDQIADGGFGSLYAKWFKSPPPPSQRPETAQVTFAGLPDTIVKRDSIPALANSRKLRVGYVSNADPLAFANREQANGFEVDLLRELARRWFDAETAAQFVPYQTADALAGGLQTGAVDAGIGGLRANLPNNRRFEFTPPIFLSGVGLLTLASNKGTTFGDFGGRTVGVLRDGVDPTALAALKTARGVSFSEVVFTDSGSALQALRSNQISAIVGERLTLFALDRVNRDTKMIGDQLSVAPMAIAVAAGDSGLKNALTLGLQELLADGTFAKLYRKWLDEPFKAPFESAPGEAVPSRSLIVAP